MSTKASATFQERKLSRQFRALDVNGDGDVTGEDYEATARRILAEFRVDHESPKGHALIGEYLAVWNRLREKMDANGDGKISLEEFLTSTTGSINRGNFLWAIGPVMRAIVSVCDGDGDNMLTNDELRRLLLVMGTPAATVSGLVGRVDTDGDGRVSGAEFVKMIEEFYRETDSNAPGSTLFGEV